MKRKTDLQESALRKEKAKQEKSLRKEAEKELKDTQKELKKSILKFILKRIGRYFKNRDWINPRSLIESNFCILHLAILSCSFEFPLEKKKRIFKLHSIAFSANKDA
jgi:uncharacterized protein (DUF2164 family)